MDPCNINDIKNLLGMHGFRFSKSMGQNFLIAGWVPDRIAEEAGLDETFGVLEIGPGIGALTSRICERAAKIVAVELDKNVVPMLNIVLKEQTNVEVVSGDVLKLNIGELLDEKLPNLRHTVCANLPYNITTPVLSALIDTGRFETITVMVQREVARRICAKAGTSDYGAFSVYAGYHMQPEILFDVGPECFMPQPKVYSSVIKLTRRDAPPAFVKDKALFFRVVRASFAQRRKTLLNALYASFGNEASKEELSAIIKQCGYDERIRGEVLDITGFAKIAERIGDLLK